MGYYTKPRAKYQAVSLPKEFVEEVTNHVRESKRYRSVAEFVKFAVMNQMNHDKHL